jgi:hypothetical protein
MRRRLLPASFLLLLAGLAGCAHQSAGGGGGYAGTAFGECEFGEDCYGPDNTPYACVFYQAPAMPARLAITVPAHRHAFPRVVDRGDSMPGPPPTDSSGSASSSMSAAPPPAPPLPAREPVVLASPAGGERTPRTPN